jgi:hypothetical protein
VQVFDLWFEENERDELLKSIAIADLQAGGGSLVESQAFLGSYWPSFLRRHIDLPEAPPTTAGDGSNPLPAAETARALPPAKPPSPSMTDRLKTWIPKSWR